MLFCDACCTFVIVPSRLKVSAMNCDKIPVFSRDAFFTFVTVEYYSRDADEDL